MSEKNRLRISEIFYSLQGESTLSGLPTVFVRLTGCPLRCVYCDTSYAFQGGSWYEIDAVVDAVRQYPAKHVCVTGGEPLAQKACLTLMRNLCDEGLTVSLETSGALDISAVDSRVIRVMDLKTPSSEESDRNLMQNIDLLTDKDQVKFVIMDESDYSWTKQIISQYQLVQRCEVLLSPVWEKMSSTALAEKILADGLNVRMQLQLHKLLWGQETGR